jgi:hypothetical protein
MGDLFADADLDDDLFGDDVFDEDLFGAAECTWIPATNADVARDGTIGRYRELLAQPVGTEVQETHNGRLWKLQVVSRASGHTTFAKDVRGWICPALQPLVLPDEQTAWDQYYGGLSQAFVSLPKPTSQRENSVERLACSAYAMLKQRRVRYGTLHDKELSAWDGYYASLGPMLAPLGALGEDTSKAFPRFAQIADQMLAERRKYTTPGGKNPADCLAFVHP